MRKGSCDEAFIGFRAHPCLPFRTLHPGVSGLASFLFGTQAEPSCSEAGKKEITESGRLESAATPSATGDEETCSKPLIYQIE